jgi:ribosomal-protein-alanine N-acetyltransferase
VAEDMFQTERVRVRHLTENDLDALYAVYGDAEAMRWVDDGEPIVWEDCVTWLDVTLQNYDVRGYGMSALVLKSSGQVIGFCGVVHPGGQLEPEIKYALLRDYWGQGLATEVVRGMLAYVATHFALDRVIATIDPSNGASRRVLVKSGMLPLKTEQDEAGDWVEMLVWMAES